MGYKVWRIPLSFHQNQSNQAYMEFNLTQYKGNFGYGHGGNGLAKSASFHDRANGITIVFAYNHMADHDNNKRVELSTKLYDMALAEIGK